MKHISCHYANKNTLTLKVFINSHKILPSTDLLLCFKTFCKVIWLTPTSAGNCSSRSWTEHLSRWTGYEVSSQIISGCNQRGENSFWRQWPHAFSVFVLHCSEIRGSWPCVLSVFSEVQVKSWCVNSSFESQIQTLWCRISKHLVSDKIKHTTTASTLISFLKSHRGWMTSKRHFCLWGSLGALDEDRQFKNWR